MARLKVVVQTSNPGGTLFGMNGGGENVVVTMDLSEHVGAGAFDQMLNSMTAAASFLTDALYGDRDEEDEEPEQEQIEDGETVSDETQEPWIDKRPEPGEREYEEPREQIDLPPLPDEMPTQVIPRPVRDSPQA